MEKVPVSTSATVGIYNYARGADYVAAADTMIEKDLRVNGEFYVAPVYDHLLAMGQRVEIYDVGDGMHGLGTPEDLEAFLALDISRRAAGICDRPTPR